MIVRVDIENLVIVERASFAPGAGLTAVTGETGAGKTLLAAAIGLLFGGDADESQVGAAGSQAWVEGEFEVDASFWRHPDVATLAELRPEHDAPLVLARRVERGGRSRALAWGRTVARSDLAAAGRLLVATAGQHVQVRLRSASYQRQSLDAAGDAAHRSLLEQMEAAHHALAAARRTCRSCEASADDAAARADQLRDELARIDAVGPSVEDEQELIVARDRARHHVALVESLAAAAQALDGGSDGGAIDLAGRAGAEVQRAVDFDPELEPLASTLAAAQDSLSEAATALASRLADLAEGPGSLEEIEDRLGAYDELQRRFGGTTDAVLARWEVLREQVALVDGSSDALERARRELAAAEQAAMEVAGRLTRSRRTLAERLEAEVSTCLGELGMSGSQFRVSVERTQLGASGGDDVSFLLAPGGAVEPRPVAQVASGGELSRVALALLVATGAHGARTILFDEIDAGIGGHTAHAVATMLRRLADERQVVCITHLPQVAARAEAHVVIEKSLVDAAPRTTLRAVEGEEAVVDELVRMLGADETDEAARLHARQLRGTSHAVAAGSARQGRLPAGGA